MRALPSTSVPPAPEVRIDALPGRQVMGQQAPGTAPTQAREDRLQDLTRGRCLRPPTGLGGRHQMADHLPFFVAQVGRVRFARFHTPSLPKVIDLSDLFKHALSSTLYNMRISGDIVPVCCKMEVLQPPSCSEVNDVPFARD